MNGTMTINQKGNLEIGGCDVTELKEKYGTPLYILDEEEVISKANQYIDSLRGLPSSEVIYAGKAFLTVGMSKLVSNLGLGLDVVSGGELYAALKANFPTEKIYFHGNNKSAEELSMALHANIGRIVVDNEHELRLLSEIAVKQQKTANILIRITPGVEAHTHSYIQTGQLDSKFGNAIVNGQATKICNLANNLPGVKLQGLHCHIGSQIFDITSFKVTVDLMMKLLADLAKDGIELGELDLGGGLGIRHTDEDSPVAISSFGELIVNSVEESAEKYAISIPKIMIEPGRSLVGEAGTTLYTVGSIKEIPGIRTYVSVDGGMGDNPRVALYQAKYDAIVANKASYKSEMVYSIAGKCCESGDMLIYDAKLPKLVSGDLLAVLSTGAYNYSMASNYNMLPRPAVVTVCKGESELIVERETYEDLVRLHKIPNRWKMNRVDSVK